MYTAFDGWWNETFILCKDKQNPFQKLTDSRSYFTTVKLKGEGKKTNYFILGNKTSEDLDIAAYEDSKKQVFLNIVNGKDIKVDQLRLVATKLKAIIDQGLYKGKALLTFSDIVNGLNK